MKKVMREQIKKIFSKNPFKLKDETDEMGGYWMSGYYGEGKLIVYWEDGSICVKANFKHRRRHGEYLWLNKFGDWEEHSWWKDGNNYGEYKSWDAGKLDINHQWVDPETGCTSARLYKNPKALKKYNIKPGYMLGGDGKYYKDEI